jgi:hypothetical protein
MFDDEEEYYYELNAYILESMSYEYLMEEYFNILNGQLY